jgi:alkylation response protein AidB-like acyl-CoA dehydrogenase
MNIEFSHDELRFRDEVASFIAAKLDPAVQRKLRHGIELERHELIDWTRTLHRQGWAVPHWPVEWGGTGWSLLQQLIFREQLQLASAPEPLSFGVSMVGPVIYTFGSEEQKRRFLPRIATLEDWWCQGFSEPGAGSDLASLKTTARRTADHWIIDGQKTWTTLAQHANWIFLLARTDVQASRKQRGISFLLVDMRTSGITVKPIRTIDGGQEINEVFFDEVIVPLENLVGEENKGWDYAKFLLGNERIGQARVGLSKKRLRQIRVMAASGVFGETSVMRRADIERRLVELEVGLKAHEITQLRVLSDRPVSAATGQPDPLSSMLKVRGSEILQATTELMLDLAGVNAMAGRRPAGDYPDCVESWLLATDAASSYFNHRKVSIYGGSNEIQRNIIGHAVLAS